MSWGTKNTKVTGDQKFVSFCLHSVSKLETERGQNRDKWLFLIIKATHLFKWVRLEEWYWLAYYGQICHCPSQQPLSTCLQCDDVHAMCLTASIYYKVSCKLHIGVTGRLAGMFFQILQYHVPYMQVYYATPLPYSSPMVPRTYLTTVYHLLSPCSTTPMVPITQAYSHNIWTHNMQAYGTLKLCGTTVHHTNYAHLQDLVLPLCRPMASF